MHAILAALFAALFSFCHASTTQHALNEPETVSNQQAIFTAPGSSAAELQETEEVYADGACRSCLMMNVTYSVR